MDASAFEQVYGDFHAYFAPQFGRSETQDHSRHYLQPLLVQSGERRNAENLSETVPPSALESSDLSVVAQRWSEAGFAARVSAQGLVSIRRRTKAGLEKAKADGKKLGAPRRLSEGRRPRSSRWWPTASVSGASPGLSE